MPSFRLNYHVFCSPTGVNFVLDWGWDLGSGWLQLIHHFNQHIPSKPLLPLVDLCFPRQVASPFYVYCKPLLLLWLAWSGHNAYDKDKLNPLPGRWAPEREDGSWWWWTTLVCWVWLPHVKICDWPAMLRTCSYWNVMLPVFSYTLIYIVRPSILFYGFLNFICYIVVYAKSSTYSFFTPSLPCTTWVLQYSELLSLYHDWLLSLLWLLVQLWMSPWLWIFFRLNNQYVTWLITYTNFFL